MTDDERKKRILAILDKHDEAARLMREAIAAKRRTILAVERVDTGMGTSIDGLRTVLDGYGSRHHCHA